VRRFLLAATCLLSGIAPILVLAENVPDLGAELEKLDYPFPVERFEISTQRQSLSMAYMDVRAEEPDGPTAVLLHGKNFCGATWEGVIRTLTAAGYRAVAPDQIGFCKSSKPESYQFSFQQLAANTRALTQKLGAERIVVIGHSMGGMLAMRYALMYPDKVAALVLINPIGLEDWQALGVPYQTVDDSYRNELRTDFDSIKAYQVKTYYDGTWRPEYERWVRMLAGMYAGPGRERVAWNQAQAADMIFTQPVVYELDKIKLPTLLIVGERDTTAIGKSTAPPDVAKRLGDYTLLGIRTSASITKSRLVQFPDLGHAPHIQDPARVNRSLRENLDKLLGR